MPRAASALSRLTTSLTNLYGERFYDASNIESAYQELIYDNACKDYIETYGVVPHLQVPAVASTISVIQQTNSSSGGSIPAGATYWYGITVVTSWGESALGTVAAFTSGTSTSTNQRTVSNNQTPSNVPALYYRIYRSTVSSSGPFYLLGSSYNGSFVDTGQDLTANAQPPSASGTLSEHAGYYRSWQFSTADVISSLGTYIAGPTGTRVRMVIRLQSTGAIVASSDFVSLPNSYASTFVDAMLSSAFTVTPNTSYLIGVESESNQLLRPYTNWWPADMPNGYASEGAGYYSDDVTSSSTVTLTQNTIPVGLSVPFQLPLRVVRQTPLTVSTLVSSAGRVEAGQNGRTITTLKASSQPSGVSALTVDSNLNYSVTGATLEVSPDGGSTWTTLVSKVKSFLSSKAYSLKFRVTSSTDFYDSFAGSGAGASDRTDSDHAWTALSGTLAGSWTKTSFTSSQGSVKTAIMPTAANVAIGAYTDAVDIEFEVYLPAVSTSTSRVFFRYQDASNYYYVSLSSSSSATSGQLGRVLANTTTTLLSFTSAAVATVGVYANSFGVTTGVQPITIPQANGSARMRIVMVGSNMYYFKWGVLLHAATDASFAAGRAYAGFRHVTLQGSDNRLSDIRIAQPYPGSSLDWLAAYLES